MEGVRGSRPLHRTQGESPEASLLPCGGEPPQGESGGME